MNLLETLIKANDGALVQQMAQRLGIGEDQARSAMRHVVPALSRGIQRNAARPEGLGSLLDALASGRHQRYVEQPDRLSRQETIDDGNAILGHILRSKDVSRNVAGHAAAQTGLDASILKRMLPMLAAAAMGSLSKQLSAGGSLGGQRARSQDSALLGAIEGFLDADRDGSVLDDVIGMAKKLF